MGCKFFKSFLEVCWEVQQDPKIQHLEEEVIKDLFYSDDKNKEDVHEDHLQFINIKNKQL